MGPAISGMGLGGIAAAWGWLTGVSLPMILVLYEVGGLLGMGLAVLCLLPGALAEED